MKTYLYFSCTTLLSSNEEMNDIMKIVKSLEEFGLLVKGLSDTIQNEANELKDGFLSILLAAWDSSLLGNLLIGKDTIRASDDKIKVGQDF